MPHETSFEDFPVYTIAPSPYNHSAYFNEKLAGGKYSNASAEHVENISVPKNTRPSHQQQCREWTQEQCRTWITGVLERTSMQPGGRKRYPPHVARWLALEFRGDGLKMVGFEKNDWVQLLGSIAGEALYREAQMMR